MSSEQNKTIVERSIQEMSNGKTASGEELAALTAVLQAAQVGNGRNGRGSQDAQDAHLARIAAHVAEEAAMLRRRS